MKNVDTAYNILVTPFTKNAWAVAVSLSKSPKTVYELEADTGLAQTSVSSNLTRLSSANLVEFEREGKGSKYKRYRLNYPRFITLADSVKRLI